MIKILVAIDGLKYSVGAATYAIEIARTTKAHLVGVFLEDFTYRSYKIAEVLNAQGDPEIIMDQFDQQDRHERAKSVERFQTCCEEAGIQFSIHHDRNIAMQELLHESIYADLLIIDRKETFTAYSESIPTRFVSELLSEIECPVLVVPSEYHKIDNIALLYDGSPVSVYAIKTFSQLFGPTGTIPCQVITVNRDTSVLPDKRLMGEFMRRHFPAANYNVLAGDPENEIIGYLENQEEGTLVVVGAYQRSVVSRWFKASMADIIMKNVSLPLFITHN